MTAGDLVRLWTAGDYLYAVLIALHCFKGGQSVCYEHWQALKRLGLVLACEDCLPWDFCREVKQGAFTDQDTEKLQKKKPMKILGMAGTGGWQPECVL